MKFGKDEWVELLVVREILMDQDKIPMSVKNCGKLRSQLSISYEVSKIWKYSVVTFK